MFSNPGIVEAVFENSTNPTWSKLFNVVISIYKVSKAFRKRVPGCILVMVLEISNRITVVLGPVMDETYQGLILGS